MIIKKLQPKRLRHAGLRHAGLLPFLMALLAACWLAGGARPAAGAGTYVVTSTLDDGSDGTLRSAVALADADPGAAIVFGPGVSGVIALQSELDLSATMNIFGPGAGVVLVDGGGATRLFSITSSAQAGIYSLGLQGGSAFNDPDGLTSGAGGAIYNGGTLTLVNCALNSSIASYGGAVYNGGSLAIVQCSFSNNGVGDGGGGGAVYNGNDGALSATGCSFNHNSAFYAGGLYNGGGMYLAGCTIGGNSAYAAEDGNSGSGAGVYNDGAMALVACVVGGNAAYGGSADDGGAGGGFFNGLGASVTLVGCTFSGNLAFPGVSGPGSGRGAIGLGGGLDNQGAAALTDDIFYGDLAALGAEIENDVLGGPGASVTATACDIQGSSAAPGLFGPNVLDVDPLFVRPVHSGGGGDPGDLHLQTSSPCLGAGVADLNNGTDRDGNPRPDPPAIGAYEYPVAPPVADPQGVTTAEDTPAAVTLAGSDSDSLPLTYQVVNGPANGTLTGTAPNLTYTPAPGYLGADSFTFTVNNGTLGSPPATVSLSVTPATATDVTGQVSIGFGGFSFRPASNTFAQQVTFTNTGTAPLAGPLTLALDLLSHNARLLNATGATAATSPAGSPTVGVSAGGLAPGASVYVNLSFSDLNYRHITYAARLLAGSGD